MTLNKEQRQLLNMVRMCPKKLRKELLKKVPASCIKAICECSFNTLKGHVPLTKHQKGKLSPYKRTLRQLANKRLTLGTKRKLVIQKGGFLNILIPAALSAFTALFNGVR